MPNPTKIKMQLLSSILALATLFLQSSLVAAEACVAGGPSQQVSFAKQCCFNNGGTWYQFYDVQAIVSPSFPCPPPHPPSPPPFSLPLSTITLK